MNKVKEKKRCWNCNGDVPVTSMQCMHCGADVSSEQDLDILQKSPYQFVHTNNQNAYKAQLEDELSAQRPPYTTDSYAEYNANAENLDKNNSIIHKNLRQGLKPLFLLLPGAVLFIFSLFLFFFAKNGVLILRWKSFVWPFYLFISLPLLYYGWKSLNHLDDETKY